jgi:CBS domain-containing protein
MTASFAVVLLSMLRAVSSATSAPEIARGLPAAIAIVDRAMQHATCMKAGELCVRDVATARPDEPVAEAVRRMAELDVGDLVVVEEDPPDLPKPIGIVTDRDLIVYLLARRPQSISQTLVADVTKYDPVIGYEDEDIEAIVARMREHGIRRIPIVDRHCGLQGIISLDDVLCWMRDQLDTIAKVLEHQGRGPRSACTSIR